MRPHALLVYNPRAGPKGGRCSHQAISDAMEGWGWIVERMPCTPHGMSARVRSAVARGCDPIVVAGGDGTVNLVINGMVGSQAALGVVPCGSANDFARSVGLPLEIEAALEVIHSGDRRRLDVGWVNGQHFLNVASLGMGAEIAQHISPERKRRWGRWAYLVEVVARIRGRQVVPLRVCMADVCETLEAYQVTIANGSCFGGGFRVSNEATFEDGLLDVVLVEPGLRNLAQGAAAPGATLIERIGGRSHRLADLKVESRGRILVNVDGESLWLRSPLTFKVVPSSLTVCLGRP